MRSPGCRMYTLLGQDVLVYNSVWQSVHAVEVWGGPLCKFGAGLVQVRCGPNKFGVGITSLVLENATF